MKKLAIVFMVTVLGHGTASVRADLTLDDGGTHCIDYRVGDVDAGLFIYDGPCSKPTTVNFKEGGYAKRALVRDSSIFNMYGGRIDDGFAALDNSRANIYGGVVNEILGISDNSMVNFYGGRAWDEIILWENGVLNIYGGNVNQDFIFYDGGVLNFYGADFTLDGEPVAYGPLDPSTEQRYLTGTLHMGDLLSRADLRPFTDTTTVNLIEMEIVPLPGAVLLGMIGLGIAGAKLRKRT